MAAYSFQSQIGFSPRPVSLMIPHPGMQVHYFGKIEPESRVI